MNKPIIDNSFTEVRSKQNTSCNWTGSADFGRLVPFHIEELVPTDKVVTCRPRIEMQMLPLASPTFGKMDLYVHYFFVPTRLLWSSFKDFISGTGPNKNATAPYITLYDLAEEYHEASTDGIRRAYFKHWTSLGLPGFFTDFDEYGDDELAANLTRISKLPFRAYQQIWWDFFRDPEVLRDDSKDHYIDTSDGGHSVSVQLAKQCLYPRSRTLKDNWIANLFAQSGLESSSLGIPLATSPLNPGIAATSTQYLKANAATNQVGTTANTSFVSGTNNIIGELKEPELRKLEALTRLAERLSLGGKREIEALFARYGVKPTYDKLQMCQYVGGSKSTVLVSDITATADTSTTSDGQTYPSGTPLGAKAGSGYCAMNDLNIEFTASEHGYLVGIFSVMPHVHFIQGLDKKFFRNVREDWFQKPLERVGQIAVSKKEVGFGSFYKSDRANDDKTFAFTQPYYEYKMGRDILAADMLQYHYTDQPQAGDEQPQQIQFMQSMSMYVDYIYDRAFTLDNLRIDHYDFNKIFYYLGGSLFTDVDDHFMLCIDKEVIKDSPMDGYAVPTLETTADPHKASGSVGGDVVL